MKTRLLAYVLVWVLLLPSTAFAKHHHHRRHNGTVICHCTGGTAPPPQGDPNTGGIAPQ